MDLLIQQETLLALVHAAAKVSPKTSPKPILTHLLLEATDSLTVTATDQELTYVSSVPAQIEISGAVVVPAQDLLKVVQSFPKSVSVHLQHVSPDHADAMHRLELRSGPIYFSLNTLPAEEFPALPDMRPEELVSYTPDTLLRLLTHTSYAMSMEENRYYLGGVHLEQCDDGPVSVLRTTATDGHRLALSQAVARDPLPTEKGVILSRKLVVALQDALGRFSGALVSFGFQDSLRRLTVRLGDTTLSGLLVDGSFPDYQQVIPKKTTIHCVAERVPLMEALRRISLMSPEKTGGVRWCLDHNELTLSSQHTSRGKGKQVLKVEGDGELEVGYNAVYLVQALESLGTQQVRLSFTNHLSPCRIDPVCDETEDTPPMGHVFGVVMPIRL